MVIATLVMYLFGLLFLFVFPIHIEKYDFFSKALLISTSFIICFMIYYGTALTLRIEEAKKKLKVQGRN